MFTNPQLHNAKQSHKTKHPFILKIVKDFESGKSLEKYREDEPILRRMGTNLDAITHYLKSEVKVKKEKSDDGD